MNFLALESEELLPDGKDEGKREEKLGGKPCIETILKSCP